MHFCRASLCRSSFVFRFFLAGSSAGSLSVKSSACFSCSSSLRMPCVMAANSGVIDCIIFPWYFVM